MKLSQVLWRLFPNGRLSLLYLLMMVQVYSSPSKHHVITISKRKCRLFSGFVILFLLTNVLFFTKTFFLYSQPQQHNDANANVDPGLVGLQESIFGAYIGSQNRYYADQQRKAARAVDLAETQQINSSPERMFPTTQLEEAACADAKSSGKCMFEARHVPPSFGFLEDTAKNDSKQVEMRKAAMRQFSMLSSGIALVVTFNRATNYEVAPLVEAFYRFVFVKIIFCGPSTPTERFAATIEVFHGSAVAKFMKTLFISYSPDIPDFGENLYTCFNLALASPTLLGPLVEADKLQGVVVMADDVLFNYWNLFLPLPDMSNGREQPRGRVFDFSKSHVMDYGTIYDIVTLNACQPSRNGTCHLPNPWPNWPRMFQPETINFYLELENLAKNKSNSQSKFSSDCLESITARTGGPRRVLQSPADLFYIARQHFETATAMFDLANRHKVFQEVAVQTTFACFSDDSRVKLDSAGDNTDGIGRKLPWAGYQANWLFMHPFKLSLIVSPNQYARDLYLTDRCLFCMLSEFSKQFRYNLVKAVEHNLPFQKQNI